MEESAIIKPNELDISKLSLRYHGKVLTEPVEMSTILEYIDILYDNKPLIIKSENKCLMRCECQIYDSKNGYVKDITEDSKNVRFSIKNMQGIRELDLALKDIIDKYIRVKGKKVDLKISGDWISCRPRYRFGSSEINTIFYHLKNDLHWKEMLGRDIECVPAINYNSLMIRNNQASVKLVLHTTIVKFNDLKPAFDEKEIEDALHMLNL